MRAITVLILALGVAGASAQDTRDTRPTSAPSDAFTRLDKEYQTLYDAWNAKMRDALRKKDDALRAALQKDDPTRAFCPRFEAAARERAGTEDAVPFLLWVVSHGRYGVGGAREAVATLVEHHVQHPGLKSVPLCVMLMVDREGFETEKAVAALTRIVDQSPHVNVRTQACFYRAMVLKAVASVPGNRERAKADFALAADLAKQSGDAYVAKKIAGCLYELDHLQIGMVAPDIEGEDLDGKNFKLSEYRGKVVLLDFWGHW